jgi:hypothetical protein
VPSGRETAQQPELLRQRRRDRIPVIGILGTQQAAADEHLDRFNLIDLY